ncbi:MAG: hypothetical protein JXR97_05450, partial [Planctomycetes bacterium]|nr:hypothetical protein [Planctomycetota bacterium]
TGYIEGYPILKGQETKFTTTIKSGTPYLVCNLSQDFESKEANFSITSVLKKFTDGSNRQQGLSLGRSSEKNKGLTQVWVRAYKIGGMNHEEL